MKYKKIIIISLLLSTFIIITELFIFNKQLLKDFHFTLFESGIIKTGFNAGSYLLAVLSLSLLIFTKSKKIFLFLSFIAVMSYLSSISNIMISGNTFGLSELQLVFHEADKFTVDVWNSYSSLLLKGFAIVFAMTVLVFLLRKKINHEKLYLPLKYIFGVFTLSITLVFVVVYKQVNTQIPYPTPIHFISTIVYYFNNAPYFGERAQLIEKPSRPSSYDNIIWIVDESIGGKYLSINSYDKDTTPYLKSISDKYLNLGVASSTGNCSAISNLLLLSGLQLNQLPDTNFTALKKPSIFQYAHNAGYKTHYISGQSHDNKLQNFMTRFDLKHIDEFYQPPKGLKNKDTPEKDIIDKTAKALANNEKSFIYIVKRGVHFHYESAYPNTEKARKFKPILKLSDNLILENKDKALNSYANAIMYKVDQFFKDFLELSQFDKKASNLIIYTSDHGQSIVEGPINNTHCNGHDPYISQGEVPILIFTNDDKKLFSNTKPNKHNSYQIFPTTLDLMGYDIKNGKSMLSGAEIDQKFFSGDIFGRSSNQKTDINK